MFFTRHLSKMLLVMGLATSACFLYVIAPEWGIVNILGLPYDENYAANYFDQGHYFFYPTFRTSTSSIVVVCKFIAKSTQFGNKNQYFSDNTFCSTD